MKKIYSHTGILQEKITGQYELEIDTNEVIGYDINYNKELVVDMPFLGKLQERSRDRNSCGWKEDKNYYFRELLNKHPEYFSSKNKERVEINLSPKVDKQFVSFFQEYEEFIGDTIIHHHVGQDGQAIGLPSSLHKGFGGVHNVEKALGITQNGLEFSQQVQALVDARVEFAWDNADEIMDSVIARRLIVELEKRNTNFSEEKIDTTTIKTEKQEAVKKEEKSKYLSTDKFIKLEGSFEPENLEKKLQRFVKNGAKRVVRNIKPKHVVQGVGLVALVAGAVVVAKNPVKVRKLIKFMRYQVKKIGSRKVGNITIKNAGVLAEGAKENLPEIVGNAITTKNLSSGTELVSNVINVAIASKFGSGADEISVFRPAFDLFKNGTINLDQLVEEILEISKHGGNYKKWLGLLKGMFKEPLADVVLAALPK